MTAPTLKLGGPLAIACTTCRCPRLHDCHTNDRGGRNTHVTRAPHAARVKAAPPEEHAAIGDLVLVRVHGGDGGTHTLALLVGIGEHVRLRLWTRGRFARPRLMPSSAVVRLAQADDPRVQPARDALLLEQSAAEHAEAWTVERVVQTTVDDAGATTKAIVTPAPKAPAPPVTKPADPWSNVHSRGATTTARKGW